MKTSLQPLRGHPSKNGFSLVEVVLAVGIMALGVVTILGLLPHGLEMTRKTANEQAETRIVDQVFGELQMSDWATLPVNADQITLRYFDDQGLEITEATENFDTLLTYVAEVTIPEMDVQLPSNNPGVVGVNNHLRRVIIKMIAAPLQEFDFNNPNTGIPVKVVAQLIANTSLVP